MKTVVGKQQQMTVKPNNLSVLLVYDDTAMEFIFRKCFEKLSSEIPVQLTYKRSKNEAIQQLSQESFDIAFIDLYLTDEAKASGFEVIRELRYLDEEVDIIVISSMPTFDNAKKSLQCGANDFLSKGFGDSDLYVCLQRSYMRKRLKYLEQERLKSSCTNKIVGRNPKLLEALRCTDKVAGSDIPVFIYGASGTGKELFARRLHDLSLVAGPFVEVDCGAVTDSMIESLFFGHEKGAFTGASSTQKGYIEQADGGTLFLDELANSSVKLQLLLLRVLQEKKFRRVGATKLLRSNFRLVSASNQDLEKAVEQGHFKPDLFYRVNGFQIELPSLVKRREDIEDLVAAFTPGLKLAPELIRLFKGYEWPGNIRELKNLLHVLKAMKGKQEIATIADVPENYLQRFFAPDGVEDGSETPFAASAVESLEEQKDRLEREFLARSYRVAKGNVSLMARTLGVDRSHLHQKLKRLGIHKTKSFN